VARKPTPRPNEDGNSPTGGRPVELDHNKFILICEELARLGSKYKACEALNVSYSAVQQAIRDNEVKGDGTWREAWDDAYEQFKDSLEQAAIQRARDGTVTEFRVNAATGERIPVKVEYSDRLMEVLLKGAFPERFRERISVSGTVGLEPVDAFANLTAKAKREIRAIIMRDLEEQRVEAAARAAAIEGEFTEVEGGEGGASAALEDMRRLGEGEDD
jgi:hypothetical protein